MRKMRYLFVLVLALLLAAAGLSANATASIPKPHYYVALGDSLSQGYQPGLGDTDQGYVDDLYAKLKATDPTLQLMKLGCSGETTATMINGGICTYTEGSQLAAAEAFLTAHKANIKYVTIDIGANDIDGCVVAGAVDFTCLSAGLAAVATNMPTILNGINAADGGVGASAGMTYYDPFLAAYLQPGGQTLATLSVALAKTFNSELTTAYTAANFRIADVFTKFHTPDFTHHRDLPGVGRVPLNVYYLCSWTYMCTLANIHANPAGYAAIASVFRGQMYALPPV